MVTESPYDGCLHKIPYRLCNDKDFLLVEMTFNDFIARVQRELSNPPSIYYLTVSENNNLSKDLPKSAVMHFFSSFEKYKFGSNGSSDILSPFLFGFGPSYNDIITKNDIDRNINKAIYSTIATSIKTNSNRLLILTGRFFNGKTTTAMRCMNDLSIAGYTVYRLKSLGTLDIKNTCYCLKNVTSPTILFIDNIADYIEQVTTILDSVPNCIVIIGTERIYRLNHIKNVYNQHFQEINIDHLSNKEIGQLIESYRTRGIIANREILPDIQNYIKNQTNLTIGEHVCNILNNFESLDICIKKQLSSYSKQSDIDTLIILSVACYCFQEGISYSLVQNIMTRNYNLLFHFSDEAPFRFSFNQDDIEYIIPINKLIIDRFLKTMETLDINQIHKNYILILKHLSPHVNRLSIMKRSPEARLAARMLDYDQTVNKFFKEKSLAFYEQLKDTWGWNSRFWEQIALCVLENNIELAINYAKQAVAIEKHPFPLTTLGKIYMKRMLIAVNDLEYIDYFILSSNTLLEAILLEDTKRSVSIHPFMTLINLCIQYSIKKSKNQIDKQQVDRIKMAILSFDKSLNLTFQEKNKVQKVIDWLSK